MYGLGYDIRINSFEAEPIRIEGFPETIHAIAEGSSHIRELWFVFRPQATAARL